MITINTISASKFSYNGINYFKNFTPVVSGNKISILNTYDACISLTSAPTHFSEYVVNGQTFANVALLQDALLPIIFTKSGLFTTQWGEIDGSISAQSDLQNVLNSKADLVAGVVPASQLPSYVDDVLEFANLSSFPTSGETGKIYIALDNNKVYRWSGSAYIEVAANSGVWGAITGTLSNQTDLQNALNAKANDNAVVKLTGDQTIANSKEFTGNIKSNLLLLKHNTNLGTTTGHTSFGGVENGISIRIQGDQKADLLLTNLTSPQIFELPNVSGTIALLSHVALKQDTLVSGTNIKTINGNSLLGSGDLSITASTGSLEFNATDLTVWNNGKGNIANNTSFGDSALKSNTTGFQNTAYGFGSLQSNSTGSNNTANGFESLKSNTTGNNNTANGFQSLLNNTTGSNNIANGLNALSANTTGSNNIAIGSASGILIANGTTPNLTGSNSIFLGTDTKPLADNQTNQIVIGHNATGHGSNSVTLGNSSIATTILRGNVGIGTTSPGVALEVNGLIRAIPVYSNTTSTAANMVISAGGTFERSTSSIRYKRDVIDYDKGVDYIMQMRPVYYKGKSTNDGDKQFAGLIAEEIHEIGLEEFVQYNVDNEPDALSYANMVAILIKGIQELKAEINVLKN